MSGKPHFCIIYNPKAGRLDTHHRWQRIQKLLGQDAVFHPTRYAGHGTELAQQAAESGYSIVVAAGGDGTVHEVMNGIVCSQRSEVTFGVLPLGSGNDYARNLKIPLEVNGMVEILKANQSRPVDIGEVMIDGKQQRYFCNTLGIGLGGAVTSEAKKIRWLHGVPLYGWASLKTIWKHYEQVEVHITEGNHQWDISMLYMVLAIGKAEGGGFLVAPYAELDDGWFDMVYVTQLSRLGAILVLPRLIWKSTRQGCAAIQERRTTGITLHSNKPVPVHADGEMLAYPERGATECIIRLLPGRLKVIQG